MKGKAYFINSVDPWLNLAVENWFFRDIKKGEKVLLLFVNSPCVVVGRFQNPLVECNLQKMKDESIPLVRRQSGGGTVYHDRGNLNYSFIGSKIEFDQEFNNNCLKNGLKSFGYEDIFINERNSLYVNGKKFSGAAYKESLNIKFHHGTLLLDANLDLLENCLNSSCELIESKGILSVRDQVINLEIPHEDVTRELTAAYFKELGQQGELLYLEEDELFEIEKVKQQYEVLRSWEWIYGETPKFSKDLMSPTGTLIVEIKRGAINSLKGELIKHHPHFIELIGYSINPSEINKINNKLTELDLDKSYISTICKELLFF